LCLLAIGNRLNLGIAKNDIVGQSESTVTGQDARTLSDPGFIHLAASRPETRHSQARHKDFMTLQVALHHETNYRYDRSVSLGPQTIRLRPAPHCRTEIKSYSLRVEPAGHFLNWHQDPHGNFLARVVFPEKVREFRVSVDLVAEMAVINPFDFFVEEGAERWPFEYESWLEEELDPYLEAEDPGPLLKAWLAEVSREPLPIVDVLVALNAGLAGEVDYLIRQEPGVQTPEETLKLGRGSCRDSAWLLVQILRNLGLAARFASGYLIQLVPDVESLDGPSGSKTDFTDLHAWTEVYIPGAGWIGLDPTSGLLAGEGHIPLACSPKPQSAAPVAGAVEVCEVGFEHEMSLERILESPRVTKPYDEATWIEIDALAQKVDRRLADGDVRLTMGGEPTFVSIDDMEADEWNTEAVGPTKRIRAADLISRLRDRFAPDGLLQFGQGKWYPGEPLPRWAFSLHWRGDGRPLWKQPDLIADESVEDSPTDEQAAQFAHDVAARLELEGETVLPTYEDPLVILGDEARLPANVDLATEDLEDAEGRDRMRRALSRGLGRPVAYVLPVQAWNARDGHRRWRTEKWSTRRERLYLVPGDSPAGYRLPIGSLPFIAPDDYPHVISADPTRNLSPLAPSAPRRQTKPREDAAAEVPPTPVAAPAGTLDVKVRTALIVEPRDGRLCVFLPPFETADDFVEIVGVIEETAAALEVKVHVEGYPPPPDSRLNVLQVTPDPGVIEVNIHPAPDWKSLVTNTEVLYEEARLARLGTEKFLIDGRHTGTGGGNHVVLGGATPGDSPFLRRPHLLRSLVGYWINHPSLSYLFSGLFIGPTSQAPRVDEARMDALYELEIAFDQIPEDPTEPCPPWLVDRIFRDLLVDVTGNTHRAEICIDKLYSPDRATGRLGLVEFRAFEMPPHAKMSLLQQLLVRALIARFWDEPYRAPVTRWGTALHDRFMLPHFVWSDLEDVIADLGPTGFAFEPAWFGPHFEFRFPRFGSFRYGDVEVELRQALEPWHVLGEDGAVGGTARYVDSSLERLQVRATGLAPERFEIACNGARLPMHATERRDEAVAGVRFRAWQPARCLHPTIPVHAPLVFDLFDTWTGRAVAGCQYHVAHPGGRNFESFPVNAYEAEGRRLARFFPFGHTPGRHAISDSRINPDFPMTLDLRRAAAKSGGGSGDGQDTR
jgi:uncharacterized protein (DUF2126 family)